MVGYSTSTATGHREEALVGNQALLSWRDRTLVYPLKELRDHPRRSGAALLDLAEALRQQTSALRDGAWEVIAIPSGASPEHTTHLRATANSLFERVLAVDTPTLCARTLFHEIGTTCSILIDLGATSTRFHLMAVQSPLENGELIVDFGSNDVDSMIRERLQAKYPNLELTRETLTGLKEALAHVAPYDQRCTLSVALGETKKLIDIGPIIRDACEALMRVVQDGLRQVLSGCPSDMLNQFVGNIFLFGGGARMPGVSLGLENDLHSEGLESATVRALPAPRHVVANGALKWALSIDDESWGIPLFDCAEA